MFWYFLALYNCTSPWTHYLQTTLSHLKDAPTSHMSKLKLKWENLLSYVVRYLCNCVSFWNMSFWNLKGKCRSLRIFCQLTPSPSPPPPPPNYTISTLLFQCTHWHLPFFLNPELASTKYYMTFNITKFINEVINIHRHF